MQQLLLPERRDMMVLSQMENYVGRRNKMGHFPSLIEQGAPTKHSFAVLYASQDDRCIQAERAVLAESARLEKEKKEELRSLNEMYNNFRQKADLAVHKYVTDSVDFSSVHDPKCSKCMLDHRARSLSIMVYEKSLPVLEVERYAVIFECEGPSEVLKHRDALAYFHKWLGAHLNLEHRKHLSHSWFDLPLLRGFTRIGLNDSEYKLGSSTKLFTKSHYKARHPLQFTAENIVVPCGLNTRYEKYSMLDGKITAAVMRVGQKHQELQWAVSSASHTQNMVLSRQAETPSDMSRSSFISFGSLRAGYRLQLRNIVMALEDRSIPLASESSIALFCQALWEAGPPAKFGSKREAHIDLSSKSFALRLLAGALRLLEDFRSNWGSHRVLVTIIVLLRRVHSLAEQDWVKDAAKQIRECRGLGVRWAKELETRILQMTDRQPREVSRMRIKLIEVSACVALTFCDSQTGTFLKDDNDASCWLKCLAQIYDNVLLESSGKSLPQTTQGLLDRVFRTALNIETKLYHVLDNGNALNLFLERHWHDPGNGEMSGWCSVNGVCRRWYESKFISSLTGKRTQIHIDVLRGELLVNGAPIRRLPKCITSDDLYRRVFGSHVFTVQPSKSYCGAYVAKSGNLSFTFGVDNKNVLWIEQHDDENRRYRLLPHTPLLADLPTRLVQHHSHWIDVNERKILFRPVNFQDFERRRRMVFGAQHEIDLKSFWVTELSCNYQLLDSQGEVCRSLHKNWFGRIERRGYMHLYKGTGGKIILWLPRLGLRFQILNYGVLSEDFKGYCIDTYQGIGCLTGLREMLVLKPTHGTGSRKVIVPHGEVSLRRGVMAAGNSSSTHAVRITIPEVQVKSPPYFVFDVVPDLMQLRAAESRTAHLFLALLYASCSHALKEPLTGQTGLESCVSLLQSPECWSPEPLDENTSFLILQLSKLAPHRTYYPKHLRVQESVVWPPHLNSSSAHEAISLALERLMESSGRLSFLFEKEASTSPVTIMQSCDELTERAYTRDEEVLPRGARLLRPSTLGVPTSVLEDNLAPQGLALESIRCLASNRCSQRFMRKGRSLLEDYFSRPLDIEGITDKLSTRLSLTSWNDWNLRRRFLDLYNFALVAQASGREKEFVMMLAYFVFREQTHSSLTTALCVVKDHCDRFNDLTPPPHSKYVDPLRRSFDRCSVKSKILSQARNMNAYIADRKRTRALTETPRSHRVRLAQEFYSQRDVEVNKVLAIAENEWLSGAITLYSLQMALQGAQVLTQRPADLKCDIDPLLEQWRNNSDLHIFIEKLEKRLQTVYSTTNSDETQAPSLNVTRIGSCYLRAKFSVHLAEARLVDNTIGNTAKRIIHQALYQSHTGETHDRHCETFEGLDTPIFLRQEYKSSKVAEFMMQELDRSWKAHQRPGEWGELRSVFENQYAKARLASEIGSFRELKKEIWVALYHYFSPGAHDTVGQSIQLAGLWRRVIPNILLPIVCNSEIDSSLKDLLLAYAILTTQEQRALRLLKYLEESPEHPNRYREERNYQFRGWTPEEYPEWLLFEIEQNITLRERQVELIRELLSLVGNGDVSHLAGVRASAEYNGHTIQLQMGEGKTTVLLPLIAATLARQGKLVRVTVTRSLYDSSHSLLQYRLGRMLRRRVYVFPFQRSLVVDAERATKIRRVYEECLMEKGIVLSRPQDRLSFEAKVIETCLSSNKRNAESICELQSFIEDRNRVRDLIDETDEILATSQQLMYTLGSQMECDARELRWEVAQAVLRLVAKYCSSHNLDGSSLIYYHSRQGAGQFPILRILRSDLYDAVIHFVADEIIAKGAELDIELRGTSAKTVVSFVTYEECSQDIRDQVFQLIPAGRKLQKILILRGLLGHRILLLALQKRVRVDFGIRKGRNCMAVPYYAKDVPKKKAEFADLDLAILLTHLAYYSRGLSHDQLERAFELLFKLDVADRESEYSSWVGRLEGFPRTLVSLGGVNLYDLEQKYKVLFPRLTKNTRVIDFWLSRDVFPRETMQFNQSLTVSAWNLSASKLIGFSGTNETSLLLPSSVNQHCPPLIVGTSADALSRLLSSRDQGYEALPPKSTIDDIIKRLTLMPVQPRVLIDCGALVMAKNEEFACEWLERASVQDVDAAVYFDNRNHLTTINRNGLKTAFELSTFKHDMRRCIVYLDDAHSRGVDLAFPPETKGIVTLGKSLTKDRMIQACMRLRLLGKKHSVSFLASREVDVEILKSMGERNALPTFPDVISWTLQNSSRKVENHMYRWGLQGLNYVVQQLAVARTAGKPSELEKRARESITDEKLALEDLYGFAMKYMDVYTLVRQAFSSKCVSPDICEYDNRNKMLIEKLQDRLRNFASDIQRCGKDQTGEHERELEHELEEEGEVELPIPKAPREPYLHPDVVDLAHNVFNEASRAFLTIPDMLERTSLRTLLLPDGWTPKIYVTYEFTYTIESMGGEEFYDEYVRPVTWVVYLAQLGVIVIVSPFEANELLPAFQSSLSPSSIHMLSSGRRIAEKDLFGDPSIVLPMTSATTSYVPGKSLLIQLKTFAGQLYLHTESEARAYAEFLGVIIKAFEREAYSNATSRGWMDENGWVRATRRRLLHLRGGAFEVSPLEFVRRLLELRCRGERIPRFSDTYSIATRGKLTRDRWNA